MRSKIQNTTFETNATIQARLESFLSLWNSKLDQVKECLELLSKDRVADLRFDYLKGLKKKLKSNFESSFNRIIDFEKEMEELEDSKSACILQEFNQTRVQLKRLNFERHNVIDQILHEETVPINASLVENRESIYKFTHSLTSILSELKLVAGNRISSAELNWSSWRYSKIFLNYQSEVIEQLAVNYLDFYNVFQLKFDGFSKMASEEVMNYLLRLDVIYTRLGT
jgi:hypothetical protein